MIMTESELSRFNLRNIKLPATLKINGYNIRICGVNVIEDFIFNPLDNESKINDLIEALNKPPEVSKNFIIVCVKDLNNPDEMINNQLPDINEKTILTKLGQAIKDNCIKPEYKKRSI